MKRTLMASAAMLTTLVASHAQAQSTVTLYGILDAGYTFANNVSGEKLYATSAGNQQGNRWGLRGSEDIGGGMSVIFALENGFNIFNGRLGQGGDMFGRKAYVGLSSPYGTITAGRQYESIDDYTGSLSACDTWGSYYSAHPGDLDNICWSNHVNNAIKYTSNNYNGLQFGGLYSLGGVAGSFNRNQIWSAGVNYSHGPVTFGAAYLNVKNPNYSYFGNNATSSTTTSNMTASQVYSGFATAQTQQVISVVGSYTIGSATLAGLYSNTQFRGLGETPVAGMPAGAPTSGNAKFHNLEAVFTYQLTPTLLLGGAYNYTKGYSAASEKIHQGTIGTDYFISKRTDLYADVVYQHATGINSVGTQATAQLTGLTASSTSNQVAVVAGIRHKF